MELEELVAGMEVEAAVDARCLFDDELTRRQVLLDRLRNLVEACAATDLAELDERGCTDRDEGMRTAYWLSHHTRSSPHTAKRRVDTAKKLRHVLTEVHVAWTAGAISEDHVRVFHQAANPRIADRIAALQSELIDLAGAYSFVAWRQIVANLVAGLDEDGAFDPDAERERNAASFSDTLDGSCQLHARFDRLTYATITHLVEAKADELFRTFAHRATATGGDLTIPSRPTLRAIAIYELIKAGAAAESPAATVTDATFVLTPDMGTGADEASPAHESETMASARSVGDLGVDPRHDTEHHVKVGEPPSVPGGLGSARGWRAWTLDGLLMPGTSPELAARFCDANFQALVLGSDGVPLTMGRSVRLFQPHQRLAIDIRDGGCVFPGCSLPPSAVRYHHLDWWGRDHGSTDVHRGAGLCDHDHGIPHRTGWDMFLTLDGWTWFRPPNGRSFWGQRHGVQRTGPTPDQPGYVAPAASKRPLGPSATAPVAPDAAPRPPPVSGDAPPDPFQGLIEALNELVPIPLEPELEAAHVATRSTLHDRTDGVRRSDTHASRGSHGPALDRIRSRLRSELPADSAV